MRSPPALLAAPAVAVLLCATATALADPVPRASPPAGSVVAVRLGEEINLVETAAWQGVEALQDVLAGDVLRTNALGQLAVLFADQTQVRLGRNTTLVVKEIGGPTARFGLESGAIWARAARGGTAVTVDTPAAAAAVRGTDWSLSVAEDGRTSLVVLEGQVELFNAQGSVLVEAGEGASVGIGERPTKYILVDVEDREQMLYTLSVEDAYGFMVPSALPTRVMIAEHRRIAEMDPASRSAEERVTFAELSFSIDGTAAARREVARAREVRLTGAQSARLLMLEAMILGDEGEHAAAAEMFARASPGLPADQKPIAAYGRFFARALADPTIAEPPPSVEGAGPYGALASAFAAGFLQSTADAARLIAEAEARYPDEALLPAVRAQFAYVSGDIDQTRAAIARAVDLDPDNPVVLLARAYFRHGIESDLEGARADLLRAGELQPGSYEVWNTLGLVEGDRGALREARAAYMRAIELSPRDPLAYVNLAMVHIENGLVTEGKRLLDEALAMDPDFSPAFAVRGRYHMQSGNVDAAIEDLLKATTIDPAYSGALLLLASAYFQKGEVGPGRQALENAERLDEESVAAAQIAAIHAADSYDADTAIVKARESLRRLKARGGTYTSIAASREAGSTVNDAFRLLRLNAWGRAYADLAFDVFDGGTYFDKAINGSAQPFENKTTAISLGPEPVSSDRAFSALVQGLLLYPYAASGGSSLTGAIYPAPFLETTLAGTYSHGLETGWTTTGVVSGHVAAPVPVSFTGEVSWGALDHGRSDVDARVRSAFAMIGAQPTLTDRFAFVGSVTNDTEPLPASRAASFRDDREDSFTGYGLAGWSHTIGHRNVVTVAGVAGATDTDIHADRRNGAGVGPVVQLHRPRKFAQAAINHAIGTGPFTFRYGFEAGRLEGDEKARVQEFRPAPRPPREGSDPVGITAWRGYADVVFEASDALIVETALHAVDVDVDGDGTRGLTLEPRVGAAWSAFEGHTFRVMASRETSVPGLLTLSPTDTAGMEPMAAPIDAGGRVDTVAARWDAEWTERFFTSLEFQHQELEGISLSIPSSTASIDIPKGTIDRAAFTANAWLGGGVGAFGTVAYARSENTSPGPQHGDDLPFVPEWSARAGLTFVSPLRVRASAWATFVDDRSGDLAGTRLGDVVTVDANLSWESPDRRVVLDLGVYNILDEDFDIAVDTPGWGRTFVGTLAVRF